MPNYKYDITLEPEDAEELLPQRCEFLAEPRLRTCALCAGCGTANGTTCQACYGEGVLLPPYARFEKERIYRGMVSKWPKAPWLVTIDDVVYCGFGSYDEALSAVKLWLGYVDGLGRIVDEREGVWWPGAEGRVLRVVRNKNAAS